MLEQRNRLWMIAIAAGVPAAILVVTFRILPWFMTVYSGPRNLFLGLMLALALTTGPAVALVLLAQSSWVYTAGVLLGAVAAVGLAVLTASIDDGQGALALLYLPIVMIGATGVLLALDSMKRSFAVRRDDRQSGVAP